MPFFKSTIGDLSPTLQGFTVALIMMTGAFPGIVAGQLADRFGHLYIVMGGAILFVLGVALQGAASTLSMFLVGENILHYVRG